MTSITYAALMFCKISLLFALIYIVFPARVLRFEPECNGLLDKLFISFVRMVFLTILIVYSLAFLHVYELFSLLFSYFAVYCLLIWFRTKSPAMLLEGLGMKLVVTLLDMSEGRFGFRSEFKRRWQYQKDRLHSAANQYWQEVRHDMFYLILPGLALLGAAVLRLQNSFLHMAYPFSDVYTHVLWVKMLGNNQIFHDGVYPYGYHAVLSAMAKLTFVDPYWLCRFLGPLGGVLLVLAVYYVTLRFWQSRYAALFALVLYGLVTDWQFPSAISRQTAALTQEFGAIFVLPGFYFLWLFVQTHKRYYLGLCAQCVAITFLVHLYAGAYLGIILAICGCGALILRQINWREFFLILGYGTGGVAIGMLPLGLGLALGKQFYQDSLRFIQESITMQSSFKVQLANLVTHNLFLDAVLLLIPLLIFSCFFYRKREWILRVAVCTGSTGLLYLLYLAPQLNLPRFTEQGRTGAFLALLLALLYAGGMIVLFKGIKPMSVRRWFAPVITVGICLLLLFYYPPRVNDLEVNHYEYNAAVANYLTIKREFPVLDWTIVGPTEQFDEVTNYGWHYDLLRFVQRFNLKQAQDPEFILPIPTHNVFFFTEQRPLHSGQLITTADAVCSLAPEGDNPYIQYYHTREQREILEAKAIRWLETYRQHHSGVSIFYQDQRMTIYQVKVDVNKLKMKQGES